MSLRRTAIVMCLDFEHNKGKEMSLVQAEQFVKYVEEEDWAMADAVRGRLAQRESGQKGKRDPS